MTHSRLWVAAAIIAVVIVVGFMLSVPHTRDVGQLAAHLSSTTTPPAVTLHDSYRKGVHTLSGSVLAPDACMSVSAYATTTGAASSTAIALALDLPPDSGVCLQLATPLSFSTSVAAPAGVPISVSVNGVTASTTSS